MMMMMMVIITTNKLLLLSHATTGFWHSSIAGNCKCLLATFSSPQALCLPEVKGVRRTLNFAAMARGGLWRHHLKQNYSLPLTRPLTGEDRFQSLTWPSSEPWVSMLADGTDLKALRMEKKNCHLIENEMVICKRIPSGKHYHQSTPAINSHLFFPDHFSSWHGSHHELLHAMFSYLHLAFLNLLTNTSKKPLPIQDAMLCQCNSKSFQFLLVRQLHLDRWWIGCLRICQKAVSRSRFLVPTPSALHTTMIQQIFRKRKGKCLQSEVFADIINIKLRFIIHICMS